MGDDLIFDILSENEDIVKVDTISLETKMNLRELNYMEEKHWYLKYRIDVYKKMINTFIEENKDILIIGMGTGTLEKILIEKGNCTIIEENEENIKYAEKIGIETIYGSFPWNLKNIEKEKYDYIIAFNILEKQIKQEWFLDVLKTKLKDNGQILMSTLLNPLIYGKNDKVYDIKRRYEKKELYKLIENKFKVDFTCIFENPSKSNKILDITNNILKEDDVYLNYISRENNATYDFYKNNEFKHLLKSKNTSGNQIFMILSGLSEKEKKIILKKMEEEHNKVNFIDKMINKFVENREEKKEAENKEDK